MKIASEKHPQVSYFKNCKLTKGGVNRSLDEILREIQSDNLAAKTAELRTKPYGSAAYSNLKKTLPAVMFAGTTRGGHKKTDLLHHSGLLTVDVDDLDERAAVSLRDRLKKDQHTLAAWLSPSGNGVKALFRIPADIATHKQSFAAAQAYFKDRYAVDIDPACKDVCRLCFLSHDPDLRTNEDAVELSIEGYFAIEQAPSLKINSDTERQSDGEDRDTDAIGGCVVCVEQAIDLAIPSRIHQNYDKLFLLARAVKTLEILAGKFTTNQLREIFQLWFTRAAEFLRPGQTKDEYMMEFLGAYESARIPLGRDVVSKAWNQAISKPLPPEAINLFQDDQLRLTVALCRELQIMAGEHPFFLACRTLQRLLNRDGHATPARWLKVFCSLKILKEIKKGNMGHASRYRYLLTL